MIDYEIKSLAPLNGGSIKLMENFLQMITFILDSKTNFELAQSYLSLFLKLHDEIISSSRVLIEALTKVEEVQSASWKAIEQKLLYGIGVVSNLRNFC
jgi:U3 small nucleolar RNA-associated protein 21